MILGIFLVMSAIVFVLCGADKARAVEGHRRIPERLLLGAALLGGSPGLMAGMALFRHKTRKPGFVIALAAIVLLQLLWLTW